MAINELQQTFSIDYTSALKRNVKSGNLNQYWAKNFEILDEQNNVYPLQGLYNQKIELDATKGDVYNAELFYEAYNELTPLIASEEAFWAYLTHIEYFDYVKKRWEINEKKTSQETILKRFFCSGGNLDNALARLWWTVYITVQPNTSSPYVYTEVILKEGNSDLFQNLSKSKLFRFKNATIGILRFFKEYEENRKGNFSDINRFIIQYFNMLGGVKQLTYMSEKYFYETSKEAYQLYIDSISK